MDSSISTSIKTVFITFLFSVAGTYSEAFWIAIFASMLRLFYDEVPVAGCKESAYFKKFCVYFGLCLPLTLGMVHVGLLLQWEHQRVIVASGIVASLAREVVTFAVKILPAIIERKLRRYYDI